MTEVWMNMDYKITKLRDFIEAEAKLKWYASSGYYKIEVIGIGKTEEEAKKTASLMLGQARAALHVAMINTPAHESPATIAPAS